MKAHPSGVPTLSTIHSPLLDELLWGCGCRTGLVSGRWVGLAHCWALKHQAQHPGDGVYGWLVSWCLSC